MQLVANFQKYLDGYPHKTFDWGVSNCCHWSSRWVYAATGHDPMEGLPVTPTVTDAKRLIAAMGGSLQAAWTRGMQREPIAATLAQFGDIVLVPLPDGGALVGICVGREVLCVDEFGKHVRIKISHATHAWRLGGAQC